MSDVPLWIQSLQALATPVIGIGVGVIAFMQWRTAHQKVVLDLFDRRLAVYNEVVNSVIEYFTEKETPALYLKTVDNLYQVRSKANFLFGVDVATVIDAIRSDVLAHAELSEKRESKRSPLLPSAQKAMNDDFVEVLTRLTLTSERMTKACLPYLRVDWRVASSPSTWLADRNRTRLSYADDKQR